MSFNANGEVTFTPGAGVEGDVVINYTITDGDTDTSDATLTVTVAADGVPTIGVTPPNTGSDPDAPDAGDINVVHEQGLTSGADTSETTSGSLTVTSVDGITTLTIGGQLVDLATPSNTTLITTAIGTLQIDSIGQVGDVFTVGYTYTLTGDQNHSGGAVNDTFAVTVNDGDDTVTSAVPLTIQIVDDVPVAVNDTTTTGEDTQVIYNVITNADGTSDTLGADGATLTGATLTNPADGTLSFNANGEVTFHSGSGSAGQCSDQLHYY